ncbi:hypothetical protein BB561_004256 [Smittium simulii]|uniref:FAD-binding FR-type domain-containing protein n=1 Tax=Smittium simulii TaxID=133385 RepID=A0A2T9YHD1_9FUNG|nr:hypothetical protein BB561_004256 [Smittium simulii]
MKKMQNWLNFNPSRAYQNLNAKQVDRKAIALKAINSWVQSEGKYKIVLILWIVFQVVTFILAVINYSENEMWEPAKKQFGGSFVVSRSTALLIHVNIAVVLIPVCRNFLTKLRGTRLSRIISFDLAIELHKFVGWTIVFFSLVHSFSHYRNYYIIAKQLAAENGKSPTRQFFALLLKSGPSWTGHIMLLCLCFISIPALGRFRRAHFNSIHGSFCMLKPSQPPYCTRNSPFWKYYTLSGILYLLERISRELRSSKIGKFFGIKESKYTGNITKVILHPSRVIEIQMQKDKEAVFKAGQFIYLNCPSISLDQWHPFTLTSAPEENFYSIHVRVTGDWTSKLASAVGIDELSIEFEKIDQPVLCNPYIHSNTSTSTLTSTTYPKSKINRQSLMLKINKFKLPKLIIDGPFGCASEEVFCHEVAVLFGAGIGVTPFASILKSIWYRYNAPGHDSILQKVYFIWTQKDTQSFEWFQDLLLAIEEEEIIEFGTLNAKNGSPKKAETFIEFMIYLTQKFSKVQVGNVILNDSEGLKDVITNLKSPTFYGRPNFELIFQNVAEKHPGADVGVFFCGPEKMGKDIQKTVSNWTRNNFSSRSTRFTYKKENF